MHYTKQSIGNNINIGDKTDIERKRKKVQHREVTLARRKYIEKV